LVLAHVLGAGDSDRLVELGGGGGLRRSVSVPLARVVEEPDSAGGLGALGTRLVSVERS